MEIRDNKYITEDNQVKPEFYDILSDYENRLNDIVAKTELPDLPDYKQINSFVANVNERIVKGEL